MDIQWPCQQIFQLLVQIVACHDIHQSRQNFRVCQACRIRILVAHDEQENSLFMDKMSIQEYPARLIKMEILRSEVGGVLVCWCAYIISSALGICGYFFGQITIISAQKLLLVFSPSAIPTPQQKKQKTSFPSCEKQKIQHDIQCFNSNPVTPINHHKKIPAPNLGHWCSLFLLLELHAVVV